MFLAVRQPVRQLVRVKVARVQAAASQIVRRWALPRSAPVAGRQSQRTDHGTQQTVPLRKIIEGAQFSIDSVKVRQAERVHAASDSVARLE